MEQPHNISLGEFVADQESEETRSLLRREIGRARALSNGKNFDEVKVSSVAEMGEAAGTCHMCTGEIKVRADIVSTEKGVRESLTSVLVHESIHAEGVALEGMTELEATLRTGKPPVPAYLTKVEHARHITTVVGRDAAFKAVRKDEGRVALLNAYVAARVKRGIAANVAMEEGEFHVAQAA